MFNEYFDSDTGAVDAQIYEVEIYIGNNYPFHIISTDWSTSSTCTMQRVFFQWESRYDFLDEEVVELTSYAVEQGVRSGWSDTWFDMSDNITIDDVHWIVSKNLGLPDSRLQNEKLASRNKKTNQNAMI